MRRSNHSTLLAQRCRASCSAFVGRPLGRRGGGGSTGLVDAIQARTSCSYQHSLRLPGILNGLGIRCLYFSLVAKVRIVVRLLPINKDRSSTKRMRTVGAGTLLALSWPGTARDALEAGMTNIHDEVEPNPVHLRCLVDGCTPSGGLKLWGSGTTHNTHFKPLAPAALTTTTARRRSRWTEHRVVALEVSRYRILA